MTNANTATGPKTSEGKRIAARNATTHGLFARDVVLTHLGEDPAGYEALFLELAADLRPANLLEKHYVEKIAAASWRLRRLHRWQAQVLEDPELSDAEAMLQLDRVMRHETTLHRQIDTSVRLLGRDVPQLVEGRARKEALAQFHTTEADCRRNPSTDWSVTTHARKIAQSLAERPLPAALHTRPEMLDNAPAPQQICENELPPPTGPSPIPLSESPVRMGDGVAKPGWGSPSSPCQAEVARNEHEGVPPPVRASALRKARKLKQQRICRNELASSLTPQELGAGGRTFAIRN